MKVSLNIQMGQHLTMTPQLQQAIRLLQLSTIELQQEIQNALDSNPLLELHEDYDNNATTKAETNTDDNRQDDYETELSASTVDINDVQNIPEDLPVDSAWDDIFTGNSANTNTPDEDDEGFEARSTVAETLYDHLLWQVNLTPFTITDRTIAVCIIDSLDENGYLHNDLEDILEAAQNILPNEDIELDEIVAVLHLIQQFEPSGVAARNLQECLKIQLKQLPEDTAHRENALLIVNEHLDLLAAQDQQGLLKRTKFSESQLRAAVGLIQTLNPYPGGKIGQDENSYIIPDVVVSKQKNRWRVELNPDTAPKLRINTSYASLIRRADSSADNTYLKNHLQEARWFLKSLQSRHETLLKVATCIVEHQRAFLEQGPEAMKALVLRDIAEEVELHESTVSRVTSQKYMLTPRGLFELKYFFSSHVGTSSGGECSSTAIRAMIKKLVSQEDPRKPLSDNKIADLLQEQGIEVARRTIAKYRESLNIPSSSDRKRLL
ncbi:MAG TPA: RNA polymerase factor sigma-54 [Agitococcus sp.]|nr:RNA polymerase factor sigma-54 [Agitococcus sp.]HMY28183.1 RNA polymerase factor sigma-54 [Agitococcus sp.]HNB19707.1 RNA polymerase factor sigma-54 [Agitococcus sp.]HNC03348.1 RNA polymerase factor sigma-54 [Agitococcus sp.]HNE90785.1 RNA polymerase factor sigma-54 [Agitococcus sp.]